MYMQRWLVSFIKLKSYAQCVMHDDLHSKGIMFIVVSPDSSFTSWLVTITVHIVIRLLAVGMI